MKIAVMQPYLFPYLGYFHLMHAVDKFVAYDDVNFMSKGWVRRNYISNSKGEKLLFTLPIENSSQNVLINNIKLSDTSKWSRKFMKTLFFGYKKAPHFQPSYELVESILGHETEYLSEFLTHSLKEICNFLSITTPIVSSSSIYKNSSLKGQDRIIDICRNEDAIDYINLAGGRSLYSSQDFHNKNLSLQFVESELSEYKQLSSTFTPGLSIIDVLMFNGTDDLKILLNQYKLM